MVGLTKSKKIALVQDQFKTMVNEDVEKNIEVQSDQDSKSSRKLRIENPKTAKKELSNEDIEAQSQKVNEKPENCPIFPIFMGIFVVLFIFSVAVTFAYEKGKKYEMDIAEDICFKIYLESIGSKN